MRVDENLFGINGCSLKDALLVAYRLVLVVCTRESPPHQVRAHRTRGEAVIDSGRWK